MSTGNSAHAHVHTLRVQSYVYIQLQMYIMTCALRVCLMVASVLAYALNACVCVCSYMCVCTHVCVSVRLSKLCRPRHVLVILAVHRIDVGLRCRTAIRIVCQCMSVYGAGATTGVLSTRGTLCWSHRYCRYRRLRRVALTLPHQYRVDDM